MEFMENSLLIFFAYFISGIIGCEWCQVDVDGDSLLLSPFCTHQLSCFNGVLGSFTPYGEGDLAISIDSMMPSSYTTFGPVVGAVLILCLVISLAVYFYRQNIDPGKLSFDHKLLNNFTPDLFN